MEAPPLALSVPLPRDASPVRKHGTTWGCLPHRCAGVTDLKCYWLPKSVSWKITGKNKCCSAGFKPEWKLLLEYSVY